jgi:magnesium transporter
VEDAITSGERAKATRHATHTFVTVYATRLDIDESSPLGALESRLQVSRVSAFVLPRGIVTVRSDTGFDMSPVVQRWEDDADLLKLGSGALPGLPQFVGIFGVSGTRFAWSGAWMGR